jgi:hypothetical protein
MNKKTKNMKILKVLFLLFLTTLFSTSCSENNFISDQTQAESNFNEENQCFNHTLGKGPFVHFEDLTFKKIMLTNFNINTNRDNEISFEEAASHLGAIDVSMSAIKNLTGIEKFINITTLNCEKNNINTLDLSNNINLKYLYCGNNPFEEVNLTKNKKLTHLDIRTTAISSLNLSNNTNLQVIRGMCNSNLKTVNIRNNNNAKILVFFFKQRNTNLKCIQVDAVNYSNSATNWTIPTDAKYSLNCSKKA